MLLSFSSKLVNKLIYHLSEFTAIRGATKRDCAVGAFCGFVAPFLSSTLIFGARCFVASTDDAPLSELCKPFNEISTHDIFMAFLLIGLVIPFLEEVIFRGFVWKLISYASRSVVIPAVFTTIFFIIAHGNILHMAGVTSLSIMLGFLRYKTNSIIPTTICHAVNNSVVISSLIISAYLYS